MPQPDRDSGFTLIETLVVISLMGALMAILVSGWSGWSRASEHKGAARELQSVLRQTQQRAVTAGESLCVAFDIADNSYTVRRGTCPATTGTVLTGPVELGSHVRLSAAAFTSTQVGDPVQTGVSFSSRGTAWPGQVSVVRDDSSKSYTVAVEGLTGRVSLD